MWTSLFSNNPFVSRISAPNRISTYIISVACYGYKHQGKCFFFQKTSSFQWTWSLRSGPIILAVTRCCTMYVCWRNNYSFCNENNWSIGPLWLLWILLELLPAWLTTQLRHLTLVTIREWKKKSNIEYKLGGGITCSNIDFFCVCNIKVNKIRCFKAI